MKTLPYFKWYPADAMTDPDYYLMSLAAIGLYHVLLNWSWANDGLPADISEMIRVTKINRQTFLKVWAEVEHRFPLDPSSDPPKRRDKRQQRERLEAISRSVKATESVNHRYERTTSGEGSRRENVGIRAYESVSGSSLVFSGGVQGGPPLRAKAPTPERFQEWLRAWPRVGNPQAAIQAWISVVVSPEDEAAAFAARDRYMASDEVARNVIMEPARFLYEQAKGGWAGRWPPKRASNDADEEQNRKHEEMRQQILAKLEKEKNNDGGRGKLPTSAASRTARISEAS